MGFHIKASLDTLRGGLPLSDAALHEPSRLAFYVLSTPVKVNLTAVGVCCLNENILRRHFLTLLKKVI